MSHSGPIAPFAIGVDLGGTNARAALVDIESGQLLAEDKSPVVNRDPIAVADLVSQLVRRIDPDEPAHSGSGEGPRRHAVGIGFAGMLRGWTGVVANAPNFGWREVAFRELLRQRLGPAVELYNDLNAIAYGEASFGAGKGARDLLCVYVGTGLGAGIIAGGKLYIGASHLAGELGHVKVVPGGRLCGCGQNGCIEAYVSGRNLQKRVREELGVEAAARRASSAVKLAGSVDAVHAGHLDQAAREGDAYARGLWQEIAPLLGLVIANAVTTLNPSRVVLGGGVWEGAPELRRLVVKSYDSLVNAASNESVALVDTILGETAGMLGAARLAAEGVITP